MTKYFSLYGNSTRSEYWCTGIVVFLLEVVLIILAVLFSTLSDAAAVLSGLVIFASVIAGFWLQIAVAVRRCRDAGISPWFGLTIIIPYIGFIPWIVFGCISSEVKNNGLA